MRIFLITTLVLLFGCQNEVKRDEPRTKNLEELAQKIGTESKKVSNPLSGKVLQTMDASKYTYVEIDNGAEKVWIAGPTTNVKVGDMISASNGMPMANFESKTLKRVFKKIFFISKWIKGEKSNITDQKKNDHTQVKSKIFVKEVLHSKGETSIADIYDKKITLKGKKIRVKGTVVKFSAQIMGKNWIHIQDGSDGKNDDLTITSQETVKIGDIVTMDGVLAVDKDFGYGYFYAALLEDAKRIK